MTTSFDRSPSATKLICETSTLTNPKSRHSLVISEHFFNFKLQVLVPGTDGDTLQKLCDVAAGSTYFCAALPLSALVRTEFIEAFVKKGHVNMLSIGKKIDESDVIAVTATGHLVMHVTKDTYQSLGLEGKPSQFTTRRSSGKYVIEIDLTKDCFKPGKKNYERVLECFEKRYDRRPVFLFYWEPHDSAISSVSLPIYFESLGYNYEEIDNAVTSAHVSSVSRQPIVNPLLPEGSCESIDHNEFFEWLGAVACGIDVSRSAADDYVTTLRCPEPDKDVDGVSLFTLTGFVPAAIIHAVLRVVRAAGRTEARPWCCIAVNGFADSPVSWSLREHMYNFDGDNLYAFVIWPDDIYWLYTAIGSMDVCP